MIAYYYKNIRSKSLATLKEYKAGSWVYVENPTPEEAIELIEKFDLDEGHIEDASDIDEMPRMEREGELIYLYTRFPYLDKEGTITTAPLLFITGPNLFITIASRPFPRLNRFLEEKISFTTTQRSKLALQILDEIVDQYEADLSGISRRIKSIRSRLRVEEIRNQDFVSFVLIEDQLNEFLSALAPTNAILRRILLGKHISLYDEDKDLVEDLLLNNEQSIEGCKSSIKSIINIREAYSTIMSNNLNRVIRILTVATVLISVPTLVASIYGMNVDLPYQNEPFAFSGVMIAAIAISLFLLWFFKRNRWL